MKELSYKTLSNMLKNKHFGDIYFEETQYGFNWGAASITRICSDNKKKWILFEVTTPKISVQIYVTKTGKVRIFSQGEWIPPKKESV